MQVSLSRGLLQLEGNVEYSINNILYINDLHDKLSQFIVCSSVYIEKLCGTTTTDFDCSALCLLSLISFNKLLVTYSHSPQHICTYTYASPIRSLCYLLLLHFIATPRASHLPHPPSTHLLQTCRAANLCLQYKYNHD